MSFADAVHGWLLLSTPSVASGAELERTNDGGATWTNLGSPAVGVTAGSLDLPDGCSIFAIIRDERDLSVRSDTELLAGDKVIGIGRTECEGELHRILLGETATAN